MSLQSAHRELYADDFVILSRGYAEEALAWTRQVTRARRKRNEDGGAQCTVGTLRLPGLQLWTALLPEGRPLVSGRESITEERATFQSRVGEITVPSNVAPWDEVRTWLNNLLRGWATYFSYGTRLMAYRAADHHVYEAVRGFLTRRHKVPTRGTRQYSDAVVFGKLACSGYAGYTLARRRQVRDEASRRA